MTIRLTPKIEFTIVIGSGVAARVRQSCSDDPDPIRKSGSESDPDRIRITKNYEFPDPDRIRISKIKKNPDSDRIRIIKSESSADPEFRNFLFVFWR